jgi:hypothetical protein
MNTNADDETSADAADGNGGPSLYDLTRDGVDDSLRGLLEDYGAAEYHPPDKGATRGAARRRKTMTEAAQAANRENAQHSTGPVTPEGKKTITRNALVDGFFAEQRDHVVGSKVASLEIYDEILEGLKETYRPQNFVDKGRVNRLALLHFKRSCLIDRAENGAVTRSVLGYARARRFATPTISPAELLEKDPAALHQRSDGLFYLAEQFEDLVGEIDAIKTAEQVSTAVRVVAGKLREALPEFDALVSQSMMRKELIAVVKQQYTLLKAQAEVLQREEWNLSTSETELRYIPRGKHYERIMRATRETNSEIARLEKSLARLHGPFGRRGA